MFFGNLFVFFQFQGKNHIDEATRTIVFSVLIGVGFLGVLFLVALRPLEDTRVVNGNDNEVDDELESSSSGVVAAFKNSINLFVTREMLLLSLTFFYTGECVLWTKRAFWKALFISAPFFDEIENLFLFDISRLRAFVLQRCLFTEHRVHSSHWRVSETARWAFGNIHWCRWSLWRSFIWSFRSSHRKQNRPRSHCYSRIYSSYSRFLLDIPELAKQRKFGRYNRHRWAYAL